MTETLFFDLDGTLTDSAPGIVGCISYALERHALEPVSPERLRLCVGPPLSESFRALGARSDQVDDLIESYRERFTDVGIYENAVYEGVDAQLTGLKERGIELHVATSKPSIYAERVLDHFDLRGHFNHVFGPDLDGRRGEKRALLEHAKQMTGCDPARSVMVGDRNVDMRAARHHGLGAVGALWGYGSRDELEEAGAHTIAADPESLAHAIERAAIAQRGDLTP